jgi:hypothetical protein
MRNIKDKRVNLIFMAFDNFLYSHNMLLYLSPIL